MTVDAPDPRWVDLSGRVFGPLLVIQADQPLGNGRRLWLVRCGLCGEEKLMRRTSIVRPSVKSCGCLNDKLRQQSTTTHAHTVGRKPSREYITWISMRQRCSNPNRHNYARYGGRGIAVCERWQVFENFLADMGQIPGDDYSINRIDNDRGYEPANCRWATRTEQAANTRRNRVLTASGRTMCITDWARELGVTPNAIIRRLDLGWPAERALTQPRRGAA